MTPRHPSLTQQLDRTQAPRTRRDADPNCGDGVLQEMRTRNVTTVTHPSRLRRLHDSACWNGYVSWGGHGCALVLDQNDRRQINCWGSNDFQRLGADPAIKQRLIPTPHSDNASLSSVVQIAGGARAVCAVVRGVQDQILCWGDREYANNRGTEPSYAPERVTLPEGFDQPVHHVAVSSNRAGDTICAIVGISATSCAGVRPCRTNQARHRRAGGRYRVEPAVVMERGDRRRRHRRY